MSPFYACYLLESEKQGCEGHCYIGFTVNVPRRLRQHNGDIKNGAAETSRKRPWKLILFVYGFESKNQALQFEYDWQHPNYTLRTRGQIYDGQTSIATAQSCPSRTDKAVEVLFQLLELEPYSSLPLRLWFHCTTSFHAYNHFCHEMRKMIHYDVGQPNWSELLSENSNEDDTEEENHSPTQTQKTRPAATKTSHATTMRTNLLQPTLVSFENPQHGVQLDLGSQFGSNSTPLLHSYATRCAPSPESRANVAREASSKPSAAPARHPNRVQGTNSHQKLDITCRVCKAGIKDLFSRCTYSDCRAGFHHSCITNWFRRSALCLDEPTIGTCPCCSRLLLRRDIESYHTGLVGNMAPECKNALIPEKYPLSTTGPAQNLPGSTWTPAMDTLRSNSVFHHNESLGSREVLGCSTNSRSNYSRDCEVDPDPPLRSEKRLDRHCANGLENIENWNSAPEMDSSLRPQPQKKGRMTAAELDAILREVHDESPVDIPKSKSSQESDYSCIIVP
eukprot:TRINITY_DN6993_c0_g1_i1.p1 TRINITY_DN6993_c0_g1~~TRINITY_DN6993_c0_g1_i1.p1  ORF type:complete len:506 (-),score=51.97 TRINITY_DN6993_c0_g1_i1:263-1780(-)